MGGFSDLQTGVLAALLTTALFSFSAIAGSRLSRLVGGVEANFLRIVAATALLGLYATGMGININRGRDRIECGCGGAVQPLGWQLVGRNGVLAAIAALCLVGSPYALSLSEAAAALVSGFILWVGYLLIEQIMATTAVMRLRR